MSEHWESCWQIHPVCAQIRVRELEAEVQRLSGFRRDRIPVPCQDVELTTNHGGVPIYFDAFAEEEETVSDFGALCSPNALQGTTQEQVDRFAAESVKAFGLSAHMLAGEPASKPVTHDRIPGGASWTVPAVDEPPVSLDPSPHS